MTVCLTSATFASICAADIHAWAITDEASNVFRTSIREDTLEQAAATAFSEVYSDMLGFGRCHAGHNRVEREVNQETEPRLIRWSLLD